MSRRGWVIRLGEDPGKHHQDSTPRADDVRLRLVRGGGARGAHAVRTGGRGGPGPRGGGHDRPAAPGDGEPPAGRPRVISLREARSRGGEPPLDEQDPEGQERVEPDWKDILALIIATFEVLGPFLLMLFGAAGLVYLFLRLIAH
jgi:hypothetical protein